jgi:hypothetical protein
MILLKNGTFTQDPRLTRIQQFDDRSKAFRATAGIETKKPRSYTWSCSTHLDQGQEGSCVGHGFAHELIARPAVVKNIDSKFAVEQVYWPAQKLDEWPGGSYPGASPRYEGTSVLAGAKVVKSLGYIKEYRWAFGLDDLILAVGYKGPAVIGVNWYDGMYDTDQWGYISTWGDIQGGHCLLVKGVNVKEQYFLLHNSWGPSWGVNGDAKITFGDMHYLLQEGGEACIPVTRAGTNIFTSLIDSLKNLF